jgi:hypothetical protein
MTVLDCTSPCAPTLAVLGNTLYLSYVVPSAVYGSLLAFRTSTDGFTWTNPAVSALSQPASSATLFSFGPLDPTFVAPPAPLGGNINYRLMDASTFNAKKPQAPLTNLQVSLTIYEDMVFESAQWLHNGFGIQLNCDVQAPSQQGQSSTYCTWQQYFFQVDQGQITCKLETWDNNNHGPFGSATSGNASASLGVGKSVLPAGTTLTFIVLYDNDNITVSGVRFVVWNRVNGDRTNIMDTTIPVPTGAAFTAPICGCQLNIVAEGFNAILSSGSGEISYTAGQTLIPVGDTSGVVGVTIRGTAENANTSYSLLPATPNIPSPPQGGPSGFLQLFQFDASTELTQRQSGWNFSSLTV